MDFILRIFDWIAGVSELIGLQLVGKKRRAGFILNACCCGMWAVVAVNRQIYGLLLVVIPAFVLNIRNFYRWRREDRA